VKCLARAVQWSEQLKELCAHSGDQRTELEAEAYAAQMRGVCE
jgi:hypothetical protein